MTEETKKTLNLDDLKKEMPYKWRVQSFSKKKKTASCVAYVDSRQVQDLLDDIVGPGNWQDKYEEHKGNLFCSIGIKVDGGWVWKTDCGTESNVDKQKGESSDAFKRAGVKWGIGRFLYSLKIAYVASSEIKNNSNWPYVVDPNGRQVWDLTEFINGPKQEQKPEIPWATDNELNQDETAENCIFKTWAKKIDGNVITLKDGKQYQVSGDWIKFFNAQLKIK